MAVWHSVFFFVDDELIYEKCDYFALGVKTCPHITNKHRKPNCFPDLSHVEQGFRLRNRGEEKNKDSGGVSRVKRAKGSRLQAKQDWR